MLFTTCIGTILVSAILHAKRHMASDQLSAYQWCLSGKNKDELIKIFPLWASFRLPFIYLFLVLSWPDRWWNHLRVCVRVYVSVCVNVLKPDCVDRVMFMWMTCLVQLLHSNACDVVSESYLNSAVTFIKFPACLIKLSVRSCYSGLASKETGLHL